MTRYSDDDFCPNCGSISCSSNCYNGRPEPNYGGSYSGGKTEGSKKLHKNLTKKKYNEDNLPLRYVVISILLELLALFLVAILN